MKRNACANLCKANADGYEMTEDSINVKLHKSKVKIEVVAVNLADIGLQGICMRLRAIVKELDDIENTLDLQFTEITSKEKE